MILDMLSSELSLFCVSHVLVKRIYTISHNYICRDNDFFFKTAAKPVKASESQWNQAKQVLQNTPL